MQTYEEGRLRAPFGHAGAVSSCPSLGDQRTNLGSAPRSQFDPQRKSGALLACASGNRD
jgi:hypothetical protein